MKYIFLGALCTTIALNSMNDELLKMYNFYDKDKEELKKLLENGVDPNKSNTALHAILNCDTSAFDICLNAGYNPFDPIINRCLTIGVMQQYKLDTLIGSIKNLPQKIFLYQIKKDIKLAQKEYSMFLENPNQFKSAKKRSASAYLKMVYIQFTKQNKTDMGTLLINAHRLNQNDILLTLIEKSKFNIMLDSTEKQKLTKYGIEWTSEGFKLKNIPIKIRTVFSDINIIHK